MVSTTIRTCGNLLRRALSNASPSGACRHGIEKSVTRTSQSIWVSFLSSISGFVASATTVKPPAFLPVELDALPDSVPYLRMPPGMPKFALPGRPDALKVGIVFKGAPSHENDRFRSLPSLAVLDSLFDHDDVEFYSLQKGEGAEEAAAYAGRLANFHDLGATLHSMMDTARAIDALDLVLTVDTSVAHVAGAMGKRTWLLLPRVRRLALAPRA